MTTTNEGTQRDELARELFIADNSNQPREQSIVDWEWFEATGKQRGQLEHYKNMAAGTIAAGYRKPRTITTVAEMNALPFQSVITDAYGTPYVCEKHRANGTADEWCASGTDYLQASQYVLEHGDVTVWYEPDAEATR